MEDNRSLRDLYQEALKIQDASNIMAVIHEFSRTMKRLRELTGKIDTNTYREHPIIIMFSSKIASLCHSEDVSVLLHAFDECKKHTEG